MATRKVYRLLKKKYQAHAFDGEGSWRYGGRWNSKGKRCVYVASSQSLAVLEALVHLEDREALKEFVMLEIELSDADILLLATVDLPSNWREEPAPIETAQVGDQWIDSQSSLALAIPSCIIPDETNYMLNCEHPAFAKVVGSPKVIDFIPDPRLTE